MRKLLLFGFFSLILPSVTLAQTPVVTSFTVSPESGSSGYAFGVTWTTENAGGSALVVPCVDGVKAKNGSTNIDIVCNSKIVPPASAPDSLSLKLTNISGFPQTLSLKVVPKNYSGLYNEAQSKIAYVAVSHDPKPVASFTSSASSIESGGSVKLSWSIPDALGANISIACVTGVKATSISYTGDIPCGKQVFSTALTKTGSLILNFTNFSMSSAPVVITLLPKIGATTYNGVNTGTLTVNVAPGYLPDPVVNFFKTSALSSVIFSGEPLPVSWSTEYTKGVNLKIFCAEGVTATSSKNPETVLPCGDYAFSALLATTSNLTLVFQNKSSLKRAVAVSLVPSFKNKDGYDATKTKTISLEVRPKSDTPLPSYAPAPTPQPSAAATPSPVLPAKPSATPAESASQKPSENSDRQESAATSAGEPAPAYPKDIPGVLERLFGSSKKEDEEEKAPANKDVREKMTKALVESGQLDEVESVFQNPGEATYEVSGRRSGRLLFLIPVRVKITVTADENGNAKKTEKPWWSFLVWFN